MNVYLPFKGTPTSAIAVEYSIRHETVPPHTHDYEEFVFVVRGTCKHRFGEREIPLIPGDIFLVPAHRTHSYIIDQTFTVYNVQFYPDRISHQWGELWTGTGNITDQWHLLHSSLDSAKGVDELGKVPTSASLNRLGILRLNTDEAAFATGLMEQMQREQQQMLPDSERVLRAYLEILLVRLTRVRARQVAVAEEFYTTKKTLVRDAILYIENHLAEPISFSQIAKNSYLSSNYFRSVFKEATGLSPVDYLNRLRIAKSLEYLQNDNATVAEVAASVGIHDANYFSRLFKKIIGYPPRRFKQISE